MSFANGVFSFLSPFLRRKSAQAADVQFLKADYVRLVLADHGDDPVDVELLVGADAAVDVVGQEARHGVGETSPKRDAGLGLFARECDLDATLRG